MAKYVQAKTKNKNKKDHSNAIYGWKLFFQSIFKNDAAIMGGRYQAWWTSFLIAFVAVAVALIPTFVQIGNTSGDQILTGSTYSTDVGLVTFSEALNTNDVSLIVTLDESTQGHKLEKQADDTAFKTVFTESLTLDTQTYDYFSYKTSDEVEKLKVFYFVESATQDFTILRDYLRSFEYNETDPIEGQIQPVSYLILTDNQISGALYKPALEMSGTTTAGGVSGNYSRLDLGYDLKSFATTAYDGTNISDLKNKATTYDEYLDGVKSNWKFFYNEAYRPVKSVTFWTLSGTYAAAYVIIVLFMGIVLFLVTRGKFSPNRDWKFFQSLGVGAWMSFTPALITMIVGFFSPAYAAMSFIMINSFRIMWFSMKAMRDSTPPPAPTVKK